MRFAIILSCVVAAGAGAQDAIVNVNVYDVKSGEVQRDVVILLNGDRIAGVGKGLPVPRGARVLDAKGATAYPGFIDGWTTLGLTEVPSVQATNDANEIGRWNAHMRAGAAVNPHSAHFPVARVNGITTAVVVPGGGTLPGEAALFDLFGRTVPQMRIEKPGALRVLRLPAPPRQTFTKKEAKDAEKKLKKSWKPLVEQLDKARRLGKLLAAGAANAGRAVPGQERLSLRATAEHLQRGDPWLVWADSRTHILAALRFAKENDLKLVIGGLKEGWTVAKQLANTPHGLLVGSPFGRVGAEDPYDAGYANAAALHRAGVKFGICTNSSSNVRNLPYQAAQAVAYGLPRGVAIRAMTSEPARILGIGRTHGSVEEGKVANLVLYDGDPLDARINPKHLFIRGVRVPLISRHTYLAEPFLPR